jgi:tetratricopeptide (TPR) repeat protein
MKAGFVTPSRGKRREYRFSFEDMVILRTAQGLVAAKIPPRKIVRSLQRLRRELPAELPLTGIHITAVGGDISVKLGAAQWNVENGQLLLNFEVANRDGVVTVFDKPESLPPDAEQWHELGLSLESEDPSRAEEAYRKAVALDACCVDAYVSLGMLLYDAGRHKETEQLYREAVRRCEKAPVLQYNLAIVLEDLGRNAEALKAYDRALTLDPDFADAHFNAARLHEALGHAKQAIRHYNDYRRLQK